MCGLPTYDKSRYYAITTEFTIGLYRKYIPIYNKFRCLGKLGLKGMVKEAIFVSHIPKGSYDRSQK